MNTNVSHSFSIFFSCVREKRLFTLHFYLRTVHTFGCHEFISLFLTKENIEDLTSSTFLSVLCNSEVMLKRRKEKQLSVLLVEWPHDYH